MAKTNKRSKQNTQTLREINIEPICKQIKFREQRQDALLCFSSLFRNRFWIALLWQLREGTGSRTGSRRVANSFAIDYDKRF